ncbi:MAG: hypothetical protein ACE5F9_00835 [Phycisphaerae bacterium]
MRSLATIFAAAGLMGVWAVGLQAQTASGDDAFPWEGEVTGANVYVRSGAGGNWYPTTKVDTGDRVLVLGEKFGWYRIVPPEGSTSYVDMSMIRRSDDGKTGVVTGDNVYVRAGSTLSPRKSATQIVVRKGTQVEIMGEADGFYKLVPPKGASLFISRQYVRRVEPRLRTGLLKRYLAGGRRAGPAPKAVVMPPVEMPTRPEVVATKSPGAPVEPADEADRSEPIVPVSVVPPPSESETAVEEAVVRTDSPRALPSGAPHREAPEVVPMTEPGPGGYEARLAELESELQAEMEKPAEDRNLERLRTRYRPIAQQEEAYVPRAIARIRVRQLTDRIELGAARKALSADRSELETARSRLRRERLQIARVRAEAPVERFELEGELRVSYAFAPAQRRFRLVDPLRNRTIAYVDIPRDVAPDTRSLIGRYVGIRTSAREYSPAARVTIAVASAVVNLTPRAAPEAFNRGRPGNIASPGGNTSEEPPVRAARRDGDDD